MAQVFEDFKDSIKNSDLLNSLTNNQNTITVIKVNARDTFDSIGDVVNDIIDIAKNKQLPTFLSGNVSGIYSLIQFIHSFFTTTNAVTIVSVLILVAVFIAFIGVKHQRISMFLSVSLIMTTFFACVKYKHEHGGLNIFGMRIPADAFNWFYKHPHATMILIAAIALLIACVLTTFIQFTPYAIAVTFMIYGHNFIDNDLAEIVKNEFLRYLILAVLLAGLIVLLKKTSKLVLIAFFSVLGTGLLLTSFEYLLTYNKEFRRAIRKITSDSVVQGTAISSVAFWCVCGISIAVQLLTNKDYNGPNTHRV